MPSTQGSEVKGSIRKEVERNWRWHRHTYKGEKTLCMRYPGADDSGHSYHIFKSANNGFLSETESLESRGNYSIWRGSAQKKGFLLPTLLAAGLQHIERNT